MNIGMREKINCPIWGRKAELKEQGGANNKSGYTIVDSPRAGGEYKIFWIPKISLIDSENIPLKVRLTSWLIEQRKLRIQCPEITDSVFEDVKKRQLLTPSERADRLLQYASQEISTLGDHVEFRTPKMLTSNRPGELIPNYSGDPREIIFHKMLAWIDSHAIHNTRELDFLLNYLKGKKWIECRPGSFRVTVEGYERLSIINQTISDSSQAFVAMWFDKSMDIVYDDGIKLGIEAAGYKSLRIDQKEHTNKIDDQIIAEIRRSRFVVADFTHKAKEARGGVYYEAGFAHGLRKLVIFTCREDKINDIQFDTRQYNQYSMEEK